MQDMLKSGSAFFDVRCHVFGASFWSIIEGMEYAMPLSNAKQLRLSLAPPQCRPFPWASDSVNGQNPGPVDGCFVTFSFP